MGDAPHDRLMTQSGASVFHVVNEGLIAATGLDA